MRMLERIARALSASAGLPPDEKGVDVYQQNPYWMRFVKPAYIAVDVLRSLQSEHDDLYAEGHNASLSADIEYDAFGEGWAAVIDAILAEIDAIIAEKDGELVRPTTTTDKVQG